MKGIYLVTDSKMSEGSSSSIEKTVLDAVKAGVSCVQLREKNASTREFVKLAVKLKEIVSGFNVPLIINDRIDVALAVKADGVHLGYQKEREI
ncbi:MAG: thiamine phosphate synthase [Thermodesulfobacteriota bacterium]|nr:thiamine phosphate synthase [Thermodesulfobacteriota bacterium]